MACAVMAPLARFLRSRFAATPPVTMKAHLYEAVYGTKLSTIARAEKDVPGLGPGSVRGWRLFIPLTRQTAGILFGEPGLGHDTAAQFVISSASRLHKRGAHSRRAVKSVQENFARALFLRRLQNRRCSGQKLSTMRKLCISPAIIHSLEENLAEIVGILRMFAWISA